MFYVNHPTQTYFMLKGKNLNKKTTNTRNVMGHKKNRQLKSFENLIEIDEEYQNILINAMPKLMKVGKDNDLSNFSRLTISFITNMNFLKNGMFDLYESQNTYSIKILFRVLIEYFIKFNYLFMEFVKVQDDSIAIDYYKYSKYSESVKLGNSYKKINEILDIENDLDSYKLLQEINPELKNISKRMFKEKVAKYDIYHMIKSINERINKENSFNGNAFLLGLFPIYSDLSSFVHGGNSADMLMLSHSNEKVRVEELFKDMQFALRMTISTSVFALIAFSKFDKSLLHTFMELDKIQKEI